MADKYAIQVDINAKDAASKVIQGFGGTVSKLGDVLKNAFGVLTADLMKGVVGGLRDMAEQATAIPAISQQFERLGGSIDAMRKGSAGMVADVDLMKSFNQAASLVSVDFAKKLPDAMSLLGKAAAASGQDVGFMLQSLVTGVGRVSPMILDNLGIQVSLSEATEAYAASIGKSVEELSKQEQQAAVMNVVMEKLEGAYGGMADVSETAKAKVASFGIIMQNFRDTVGVALLPILTDIMGGLSRLAGDVLPQVVAGIERAKPVIADIGTAIGMAFDVIRGIGGDIPWEDFLPPWLADLAYQVSDAFAGLGGSVKQLFDGMNSWGSRLSGTLSVLQSVVGTAFGVLRSSVTGAFDAIAQAWPGLRDTFEGLLATVGRVIPPVVSLFTAGMGAIASLAQTLLPGIIERFRNMVEQVGRIVGALVPAVAPVLEGILNLAMRIAGDIAPFVMELAQRVQTFIADIMVRIAAWLDENRELIEGTLRAIETIWNAVWPALKVVVEVVFGALKIVIGSALDVILGIVKLAMQMINGDWTGAWETFVQIVTTPMRTVLTIIQTALGDVADAITGRIAQFLQLGADLIGGLIQGINDGAGRVRDTMLNIIKGGLDAVKRFFGISSPSRVMIQVGQDLMGGLTIGIDTGGKGAAEAMQKVVSSLSKALKDLASAFHQMNKIQGEGGIPDMALWIATLKQAITGWSLAITEAAQEVGSKTINKAKDLAGKVEQIFELLKTLGQVLRDLNEVETLPDMGRFGWALKQAIIVTSSAILEAGRELGEKALKAAAKLAGDAREIIGLIGPAVQALAAFVDFPAVGNLVEKAAFLKEAILLFVDHVHQMAVAWKDVALDAAVSFSGQAQQVIGLIGPSVQALAGFVDFPAVGNLSEKAAFLEESVNLFVEHVNSMAAHWEGVALDSAVTFSEAAQKVVGLIGPAVQAIGAMPELVNITGLEGLMDVLILQLDIMLVKIRWLAEQWTPGALDASAEWAQAAEKVLGIIDGGVKALAAIAEYAFVVDLENKLADMIEQVNKVLEDIVGLSDRWADRGLDAVAGFATHVEAVGKALKAALDFLNDLLEYSGGNTTAAMNAFATDLGLVWDGLEGLAGRAQGQGLVAATAFRTSIELLRAAVDAGLGILGGLGVRPDSVLGALDAFATGVQGSMEAAVEQIGGALSSIDGLLGDALQTLPPQALALGDAIGRELYAGFSGWLGRVRFDVGALSTQVGGVERRIETINNNNYYTLEAHYARGQDEGDLRNTVVALQMLG